MARLFEPGSINGLKLKNRVVRSATWEGLADADGSATAALNEVVAGLAHGGVGLIISSHTFIRPDGQAGPGQLGLCADALIPPYRAMVEAVHAAGGRIAAQLAHAGERAATDLTRSAAVTVDALTVEGIEALATDYGAAADRARQAGCDGVQLHAAHGYLINQFISPAFNHRTDAYGGNVERRARFALLALEKVRQAVGPDFPIMIKINGQDYQEGGLTIRQSAKICTLLAQAGMDAVEVSGGSMTGKYVPSRQGISKPAQEAYHRMEAKTIKRAVDIPVMIVGGIRTFDVAERLLAEGMADYISLCRPLIREPNLVARWERGDLAPARCKSDNLCFGPVRSNDGFYCVLDHPKEKDGTALQ